MATPTDNGPGRGDTGRRTPTAVENADRLDERRTTAGPGPVAGHRPDGASIADFQSPLDRRDLVRWGPVWAGVVVILPTVLVLQLLAMSLGLLNLEQGGTTATAVWSGIIGFVGFLVGGLVAGATAMWRGVGSGILHGILVWTLTIILLLGAIVLGGGALVSSLAGVLTDVINVEALNAPDAGTVVGIAQDTAGGAVIGLLASLLAAIIGGALGAKMWGRGEDRDDIRTARNTR